MLPSSSFNGVSRTLGHPPRITRRTRSLYLVVLGGVFLKSESNNPLSDTEPSESPDSYSDMVRILIVPILPSPLCIGGVAFPSVGIDDSHRTNLPLTLFSSTLLLTPSQIAGTVCHSSIRRGSSPSSA